MSPKTLDERLLYMMAFYQLQYLEPFEAAEVRRFARAAYNLGRVDALKPKRVVATASMPSHDHKTKSKRSK